MKLFKHLLSNILWGSTVSLFSTVFLAPFVVLMFLFFIDMNAFNKHFKMDHIAFGWYIALLIGAAYIACLLILSTLTLKPLYKAYNHGTFNRWLTGICVFGVSCFAITFCMEGHLDSFATAWLLAGMVIVPAGIYIYASALKHGFASLQDQTAQDFTEDPQPIF